MKKETKQGAGVYDEALRVEAHCFAGTRQTFPNHIHAHYVIGLVEGGRRCLSCRNREYTIGPGNLILFNPGDNHGCTQIGEGALAYRSLHISQAVMLDLTEEITGRRALPDFTENVVEDAELAGVLRNLHEMVMGGVSGLEKEESLLFLLSALMQAYGQPFACHVPECSREIERACDFMHRHYAERLSLTQICAYAGLSKSTLLRAFTRTKGVTPYRYLEAVRIQEARNLLGKGVSPAEAAARTGFSDQSHFSRYFQQFIGLGPGVYRDFFCRCPQGGGAGLRGRRREVKQDERK